MGARCSISPIEVRRPGGRWNFPASANLNPVKSLRVWLLLLLAVALPLRGAMAAAMLCAEPGGTSHVVAWTGDGGHGHADHDDAFHGAQGTHAGLAHDHGHDGVPGHETGDKCSLCASCCTLSVPVVLSFSLPQAPPATARYPDYLTPRAEFVSGGPERPPRSL